MKRVKIPLLLTLWVTMMFVAACGGEAPQTSPPTEEAPPVEEATTEIEPLEDAEPAAATEEVAAPSSEEDIPRVGIMQLVSHPALDAEREGVLQAFSEAGFVEGENIIIDYQNAEGDIPTLTTIAQKFIDDDVDLIVTITTPAVQAAYNVTQDLEGPPIVFNAVTDPYAAGVATAPDDKPAWITGIQGMPPVAQGIALVMELVPDAEKIGIIWTPAEKNSEVATSIAREVAEEMGIELVEATISDSSEVQTAAESLVAQDVDAFFTSTDSTVVAGLEALIKVANENQIPYIANDPDSAKRGAAAAIGLDYVQDGIDSGTIAAQILKGEITPAEVPIEPQQAGALVINLEAAEAQGIEIPEVLLEEANQIFGGEEGEGTAEDEEESEAASIEEVELVEGDYTIGMMQIVSHPALDAGREGALQALAEEGFVEGENLTVLAQNAEGDIATLTTIAQTFVDGGVDLVLATSTPAAQAAFNVIKDLEFPYLIYNVVTDPFAAGLATGPDDHLDWVVGTQAMPPVEVGMSTMMEIAPDIETVGILWNPSEKNSEVSTGIVREVAEQMGLELIEGNVSDSSEIQTAAEALVAQDVDAFFISTDSTVVSGFEALAKVANENQIPLFANDPASASRGAVAAIGLDYIQEGRDAGMIAAQILKGEATPADFTIEAQDKNYLVINLDAAEAQGIEIPDSIMEEAEEIIGAE